MTNTAIENFRSLAPLLLPELNDLNRLEAIDDYDDYALMTFSLAEPMSLEDVMVCKKAIFLDTLYYPEKS